jgi:hypothetical protein
MAVDTLRPRRFGVVTAARYLSTVADIARPSAKALLCATLSVRCAGRFAALRLTFLAVRRVDPAAFFRVAFFVAGMLNLCLVDKNTWHATCRVLGFSKQAFHK